MDRTCIGNCGVAFLIAAALGGCEPNASRRPPPPGGMIPGGAPSGGGGGGGGTIPGSGGPDAGAATAPTFNLVAAPSTISTSDGDSMYMWLYGLSGATVQYPGPTLIVNQGDTVTITLTNQLPVATSLVFPGQTVTATGTAGTATGLITTEVLPSSGGTVTYSFTASAPGTYLYHSGTRPDLQVEMGLAGTIIVRPSGFADAVACTPTVTACRRAYGDLSTAYDREYLFFLSDADPVLHQKVAFAAAAEIAAGLPSVDTTGRHATDWFINGRNFPDTMSDGNVEWLPTQPYNAFPRMHPGEKVLIRMLGAGQDLHPLHTHGQNHLVIARDGRVLGTNVLAAADPVADLAVSDYTTTVAPGETVDAIWGPWTGARLGWDVYGTLAIHPHDCNADATGFDPATREYCADHGKPIPVALPADAYLTYGMMYGGTPYLGISGALPPLNPDGSVHVQRNPQAGLSFMWHSHNERELTTNDVFIGGMATMGLVLPVGVPIP
jgi:FtsP/CotA-like multicopper oxidase with cupredoxin domain